MYCTKKQIFFVMIFIGVLLPFGVVFGTATIDSKSINLFVYLTIAIAGYLFLYLLYQCNSWEFTFLELRTIPFVLVTFTIGIKLYKGGFSTSIHPHDWWIEIVSILVLLFLCRHIYKVLRASKKPENILEMSFPFKEGRYLITDGGDGWISALINYHYKSSTHNKHGTQDAMRYAVDIVRLGSWGRAISKSIAFSNNEEYAIFHNIIISPIDGTVVKVKDGIKNNRPFPGKGSLPYNLGNCVVIKKGDYYIIMGHMERGSILVQEGDSVHIGDKIGLVGNSGLTPRPHLHMQVSKCKDGNYWFAEGVPIVFNQTFYPVKNRITTIPEI